jgi:hypothetical protein
VGRRSRKHRPEAPGPVAAPPREEAPADRMRRGYARAEQRNAEARAQLRPLAPGERPRALVVAAAVAALLAIANLVAFAAGMEIDGKRPSVVGVLLFAGLMLAAAAGLWQRRYWAVLGFEALLGVTLAIAALALLFAANLAAVALSLAFLAAGGWLFWKLIRVMGRIQTPQRVQ